MSNRLTRSSGGNIDFEMARGNKSVEVTRTAYEKIKKEKNSAVKAMEECKNKLRILELEKEDLMKNVEAQKTAHDMEIVEMKEKLDSNVEKWQNKYYKIKQKHIDDKDKITKLLSDLKDMQDKFEDFDKMKVHLETKIGDMESKYDSLNSEAKKEISLLKKENETLNTEIASLTTRTESLQKSKKIVEEQKKHLLKDFRNYKDAILLSQLKPDIGYLPRRPTKYYESDDDSKHYERQRNPKPYSKPYRHYERPRYYS